jgi:hypothetical protein
MPKFSSTFAATIEVDGRRQVLSSDSGTSRSVGNSTEMTPQGQAAIRTSTIHFEKDQLDLMLRVGEVSGIPGVLFQAGIRNGGRQPIELRSVSPVRVVANRPVGEWLQENGRLYLDPANAQSVAQDWGTCQLNLAVSGKPMSIAGKSYPRGLGTHAQSEIVFSLGGQCERFHAEVGADDAIGGTVDFQVWTDGDKVFDSGLLTRGDPIAYLNATIACAGTNRATLEITSDMSGVQVDPGETRWGQQVILLWEKFNEAAALQTEWVAQTHHARTNKGALSGWCSWYLKTSHITGEDVLGLVDAVKNSNGRLRPAAIQIDDGYQKIDGVWDANEKFPEGMPFYAQRIAETGARPGLWMALTMIGNDAPWLKDPANMETVWGQRFAKGAGAREGDLLVFSQKPLAAKSAAGCSIKTVQSAGENVRQIHIEDREISKPQRIELKIGN